MKRARPWQKIIDRFLGVPLILICGYVQFWSRLLSQRKCPESPQSMAVFCVAALGDLLLLSNVLLKYHQAVPNCRLVLFCGPDNRSLVKLLDPEGKVFSQVHVLNPKRTFSNLSVLRREKFDVVVDSGQWARWSALMAWIVPAKWRIGFQTKGQLRHFAFDEAIPHLRSVHELENFSHLLRRWIQLPVISTPISTGSWVPAYQNYVVCHMFPSGVSSHQKEWPSASWISLFKELKAIGYEVILTGGSGDRQRLEELFSSDELRGLVDLVGKTSLEQTRDLLARAQLVISVNTGIMHLASNLEVPLIALHGPTNAKRWGPMSNRSRIIESDLACSPCLNLGFEYACPRNDCMKNITPERVLKVVKSTISSVR